MSSAREAEVHVYSAPRWGHEVAILVGIDEAGLGPVLGPLVMSSVAFEVPDDLLRESLWRVLSGTVCRRPQDRRMVVAITDSKKLYSGDRERGLRLLERGVLSALAVDGGAPTGLRALLAEVAPAALDAAAEYPWYAHRDVELPCRTMVDEVAGLGERLGRRLASVGVRLLALHSEVVYAGEFNRLIDATRNKGDAHYAVAARLLRGARALAPADPLVIHLDRHGGRKLYTERLRPVFDDGFVWATAEGDASSSYLVEEGARRAEVHFTVRCEERQLPVALASMMSKYVRELHMELFNEYWCGQRPGLRRTAGYYTDGCRFFAEIAPLLARRGVESDLVLRRGPVPAP